MCEVIERAKSLRGNEREVVAELIRELSVIYQKRLFAEAGYSSLFVFCTGALGYSEGAAWRRVEAAKALLLDSSIYERLKSGELSLCAAAMLAKVLKSKDAAHIVEQASGKSKRELEVLIAEQLPEQRPKKRQETVRIQTVSKPIPAPLFASARQEQKAVVKTFTVTLELSEDEMTLLEQAQKILSRKSIKEAVVGAAKKLVVGKQRLESTREKRRQKTKVAAIVPKETSLEKFPCKKEQLSSVQAEDVKPLPPSPRLRRTSRYIPADVRHQVEKRDGCQCSFVSADGRRCSETRSLEFDHVQPFAFGGESTAENLRLLCSTHNRLEAERVFGQAAIRRLVQFKQEERQNTRLE